MTPTAETDQTPPSGKRFTPQLRRPLAVALAMVAAVVLLVLLGNLLTRERTVESTFEAPTRVLLTVDHGDVEVVASTGNQVEVERRSEYVLRAPDAGDRIEGDALVLEIDCPRFNLGSCRSDVTVSVPATVEVVVKIDRGDIEVKGVRAALEAHTDNGDVKAAATFGPLRLEAPKGKVSGEDLSSTSAWARTKDEDIELEFSTAPSTVDAEAVKGSVDVRVPEKSGPFAVDVSSGGGKALTEVRTDSMSPNEIRMRSDVGDVHLRTR